MLSASTRPRSSCPSGGAGRTFSTVRRQQAAGRLARLEVSLAALQLALQRSDHRVVRKAGEAGMKQSAGGGARHGRRIFGLRSVRVEALVVGVLILNLP